MGGWPRSAEEAACLSLAWAPLAGWRQEGTGGLWWGAGWCCSFQNGSHWLAAEGVSRCFNFAQMLRFLTSICGQNFSVAACSFACDFGLCSKTCIFDLIKSFKTGFFVCSFKKFWLFFVRKLACCAFFFSLRPVLRFFNPGIWRHWGRPKMAKTGS